jgi:hypothetical protein
MHYDGPAQTCTAWRQFPFRCSVAEILERLNLVMGRGMPVHGDGRTGELIQLAWVVDVK